MSKQRRRDVRYSIRFPVQLSRGNKTESLLTEDVSYGGVFLGTSSPPPLLQLVRVQLVLPVGDRALKAHGMTVRAVEPSQPGKQDEEQDRVPGIGVQFYALDRETREAWEAFIRHVEAHYPKAPDQAPLRLARGETPEPVRRSMGRHIAVLQISPATIEELADLYTREVSVGGMFVPTSLTLASDARVVVHIQHPETGRPFLLEGKVLQTSKRPGAARGVGVELLHLDRYLLEEFLDFVRGGVLIDDEVIIESPEPARAAPVAKKSPSKGPPPPPRKRPSGGSRR